MAKKDIWYLKNSPDLGKAFQNFHDTVAEKGVLDAKTRELLMLSLACAFRCPYCTEQHIKKALDVGASKEEVSEALLIASLEGAGTQLYWLKDVYEKHLGHE